MQAQQVQQHVIAPNTKATYDRMLQSYVNYCGTMSQNFGEPFPAFPLSEEKSKIFFQWYRENNPTTTYGYLVLFKSAFSHFLDYNNLVNFTRNPEFKMYFKGLRREMLGDSNPKAKSFITPEILNAIADSIDRNNPIDVELITIYSMCYYGFLRINECLRLTNSEITQDKEGRLVLLIAFSKTDQTGRRVQIFIRNSETKYSPFLWLPIFLSFRSLNSEDCVFTLSQAQVRYYLKLQLKKLNIPNQNINTHSFRKGAAHQASLLGIQDCEIKAMGRWLSNCYQRYTAVTMMQAGDSITSKI